MLQFLYKLVKVNNFYLRHIQICNYLWTDGVVECVYHFFDNQIMWLLSFEYLHCESDLFQSILDVDVDGDM
jgi:hypothetical protein